MYIVAIAWLYVTLLMATAESSWVSGVLTFVFYGVAPLALLLWLFGIPRRARDRRVSRLASADRAAMPVDDEASAQGETRERAASAAADPAPPVSGRSR